LFRAESCRFLPLLSDKEKRGLHSVSRIVTTLFFTLWQYFTAYYSIIVQTYAASLYTIGILCIQFGNSVITVWQWLITAETVGGRVFFSLSKKGMKVFPKLEWKQKFHLEHTYFQGFYIYLTDSTACIVLSVFHDLSGIFCAFILSSACIPEHSLSFMGNNLCFISGQNCFEYKTLSFSNF